MRCFFFDAGVEILAVKSLANYIQRAPERIIFFVSKVLNFRISISLPFLSSFKGPSTSIFFPQFNKSRHTPLLLVAIFK